MGILNMNLNVWFDILSKYIENFRVIVSVALGIFSERLTDTSCQDFSLWFCGISLAMVTTDVKSVCWRVSFSRPGLPFFLFLYLCHSPDYSQVFVFKTGSCPLCSEFLTGLCYASKLHADTFPKPLNFFSDRTRYDWN